MEAREALEKLKLALSVCEKVRATFASFRTKVKEEMPDKPWDFDTDLIFARFSLYEERLRMLNLVFQTADDFAKLEKVELSSDKVGNKGTISLDLLLGCVVSWSSSLWCSFIQHTHHVPAVAADQETL
jgi:hypothetical protein